ncbi:uncharacterized protein LOC127287080 isoform X2 [Leptopilina boulardi]|uniref:uncharacterized protein LOC127287080 isoform X2 n=1 Tax=Leptopilina boulardi TaxID=63433 RepID=UPI0021F50B0E|nr:uncharacterized protein LOC127287080 isoform X2 [Leptopilina boulardi]
MAKDRSVVLMIVILTIVTLQWVTGVKVVETRRSLNLTTYDNELIHTNEVTDWNETKINEKNYQNDLDHNYPGKPTKFDIDITQLTLTDDKNLHHSESQRLSTLNTTRKIPVNRKKKSVTCDSYFNVTCLQAKFEDFIDTISTANEYNVTDLVQIVKSENITNQHNNATGQQNGLSLIEKVQLFAKNHVLKIHIPGDLISARKSRTFFGSFGLKKLLLPLILGAQIVKSILIALFLPSIIGSIGKIVGKGVSSFAQSSQSINPQQEENFEFKENLEGYGDDYMNRQPVGTLPASAMYEEGMLQTQKTPEIASRYSYVDPRFPHMNTFSDRYYSRHTANNGYSSKKQDFKIFHEIPTSSSLLKTYDPFYSPLLSRLDAVFYRLGYKTEGCREFVVCAIYRSPARFAPYSNLVSAQLSRELNELRKPTSDNPEVLRFFHYMKAAKDGQDGVNCEDYYSNCEIPRDDSTRQNQAMLATYQDIDKLVHARKF